MAYEIIPEYNLGSFSSPNPRNWGLLKWLIVEMYWFDGRSNSRIEKTQPLRGWQTCHGAFLWSFCPCWMCFFCNPKTCNFFLLGFPKPSLKIVLKKLHGFGGQKPWNSWTTNSIPPGRGPALPSEWLEVLHYLWHLEHLVVVASHQKRIATRYKKTEISHEKKPTLRHEPWEILVV